MVSGIRRPRNDRHGHHCSAPAITPALPIRSFGFVAPTISSDTEINKNEGTAEATYGLEWRKQLTKATSRHCSDTRSLSRAGAGAYRRRTHEAATFGLKGISPCPDARDGQKQDLYV